MSKIESYVRSIIWNRKSKINGKRMRGADPYQVSRRLEALASRDFGTPIVRTSPLLRIKIAIRLDYFKRTVTFKKDPVIVLPSKRGGRNDNFLRRTIYGRLLKHPNRVLYYMRDYDPRQHILVELIMWMGPRKTVDEEMENL